MNPNLSVRLAHLTIAAAIGLSGWRAPAIAQHGMPPGASQIAPPPDDVQQIPRGRRGVRDITYSDWKKFCFSTGSGAVCRTTISGSLSTGQEVVRVDVLESGPGKLRLQILLPAGVYVPSGVKMTIDGGEALLIPYAWCFSNVCVAANIVSEDLVGRMRSGLGMVIEAVDTSLLAESATVPLDRFAAANASAAPLDQSLAK